MQADLSPSEGIASIFDAVRMNADKIAGAYGPGVAPDDEKVREKTADICGMMFEMENDPAAMIATVSIGRILSHLSFAKGLVAAGIASIKRGEAPDHLALAELFMDYATLDLAALEQLSLVVSRTEEGRRLNAKSQALVDGITAKQDGRAAN